MSKFNEGDIICFTRQPSWIRKVSTKEKYLEWTRNNNVIAGLGNLDTLFMINVSTRNFILGPPELYTLLEKAIDPLNAFESIIYEQI